MIDTRAPIFTAKPPDYVRGATLRSLRAVLGLVSLCLVLAFVTACSRDPAPATQPTTQAAVVAVPPAPKPTGKLPESASCVTAECHARFKNDRQIHGPVATGSCMSCHQPDRGNHTYPLARDGNATCNFCHAVTGTKKVQHASVHQQHDGKGGCTTCHDPHSAQTKFLLVSLSTESLCAKCHTLPLKKHAHEPFAAGQCTVCHESHQSDNRKLLRSGEGADHCFGCHGDRKKLLATSPHVHKATAGKCDMCHGAHTTDHPRQLVKSVSDTCMGSCHADMKKQIATAPRVHGALDESAGSCASCHDAHYSQHAKVLKKREDQLCMTCHDKPQKAPDGRTIAAMTNVLKSKNLHGPVKSGDCGECHQPHASTQRHLLKAEFPETFYASFDEKIYALCFRCHDSAVVKNEKSVQTNFRDGERNLHFVHVNRSERGRTCKTCHDMHGSDLPNHMAEKVPFEGSKWAMPMNYEVNASGGTCTPGCHEEKSYQRKKVDLPAPAKRGGS